MANGVVQISPFISMMIGLLFAFSTLYGLMYFYYQGDAQSISLVELGESGNDPATIGSDSGFIGSFISGSIDALLSFVAWISPFALIRAAILAIAPTDLYMVLDIFLLRPISWAVSILTANWILSAIRGKSEGT
jgi:hypothetical protein